MPLEHQSPSKHNSFVGLYTTTPQKIPHPVSTGFYDDDNTSSGSTKSREEKEVGRTFGTPPSKRRKLGNGQLLDLSESTKDHTLHSPATKSFVKGVHSPFKHKNKIKEKIPDSDDEEHQGVREQEQEQEPETRKTQLEEALLPVPTDQEAIDAYEAQRAAESVDLKNSEVDEEDTLEMRLSKRSWKRGRSSIYVDAFHLALSTVLEDEAHLFDEAEKQVFAYFTNLSYEAQFLYVRLFLRKTSLWFRIAKLAYYDDIADVASAVKELQLERSLPKGDSPPERFPGEVDLPDEAVPLGDSFTFAECSDDRITTLNEASSLLLLDELKVLAKDAKVSGKNKTELLQNLRRTSGKQRGLGFLKRGDTEGSATSGRSTPAPEVDDETGTESEVELTPDRSTTPNNDYNRDAYFTRKILEQTGKCIRLSLIPLKLFERVHLVFYRSIEWTEKSLTTLILAKIARRNFPEYVVSRSANIFESRSMLLEFEYCLRLQFKVENILEFSGYATREDLEGIRDLFERVHPRGQTLIKVEQGKEDRVYESGEGPYLRRFSPAWVYTRVQHKVFPILGKFKEHLREHALLSELLDQRLFHPSKRGAWYQRKALLEEHYMYALTDAQGRSEEANKKHWKRISLQTCETGLQDRECHIRYHYDLQKRVKKLEKQLKIPKREQHDFGHVGLRKAYERTIYGVQVIRSDPIPLRRKSSNPEHPPSLSRERSTTSALPLTEPSRRGAKTIWLDELDTNEPVSVEQLTLSHYRKNLGFKGYHTEGGILRTLFGLLFYDVLFAYVPNVFQTAYQTCPLDLHTDAFYSTRISEINSRINELSNGDAERILRQVWTDHYERKTCIIGVRWDYNLEDLTEIARCWDDAALGTVMRVLAQEYAERGGGVPDLFMWKVFDPADDGTEGDNRYGKVMFVEVKSENDRLSDTQRLWISVLLNAGVDVELCHVYARETRREDGTVIETDLDKGR